MPPKGRKVFSWLGYGIGDRKKALKLLEFVAMTGVDLHASFASLALVICKPCIRLILANTEFESLRRRRHPDGQRLASGSSETSDSVYERSQSVFGEARSWHFMAGE